VQWMTAGSGLVHSEVSSEDFKEKGGREEILQLWMNLPSHLKMTKPGYQSFDYDEITHFSPSEGVQVNLISGEWNGEKGPKDSLTGLLLSSIEMQSGSQWTHQPAEDDVIFFYVVKGLLKVNGQEVQMRKLVEFESEGGQIEVEASEESIILYGTGKAFNEPIVSHGPFVMNSQKEIHQAIVDYQEGRFE